MVVQPSKMHRFCRRVASRAVLSIAPKTQSEPGSDPSKRADTARRRERALSKRNLVEKLFPFMKECGHTGLRTQTPDLVPQRSAKSITKQLHVATYNVRTLNNTGTHSESTIHQKLTQIIAGCEKYGIDYFIFIFWFTSSEGAKFYSKRP